MCDFWNNGSEMWYSRVPQNHHDLDPLLGWKYIYIYIYIYIYRYAHPIDSVRVVRTCRGATHLFGPQTTPAARYPEPPAAPSQQRTLPSSPLHLWFLTQDLHPSEPRPRKISTPLPFDPKDGWAVHTQKRSRRKSRRQKSRG